MRFVSHRETARVTRRRALGTAMFLALGVAFGAARDAAATVVVALSRAELVDRSDLIVRASVVDQRSTWNADHSQIVTLTRLRVATYLKGTGAAELVLRQFGGTVGQLTSRVAGDARFAAGQDVVLFLRRGEGVVFLTALAQAAYYVQTTSPQRVRRDLSGLTFAVIQPNAPMALVEPEAEPAEALDAFLRDVARLVTPAGAR
jgi:hypothetical protein